MKEGSAISVVEPITSSNSTTGAGVIDSWHSVASAAEEIKTAHGGDQAAIAVELGLSAVGAVLDTVAFAIDPLAKLIAAGLGWLIEHISFLRWPLDQVAGDPDQIKVIADKLHGIGQDLRNAAEDMQKAFEAKITKWEGQAADQYKDLIAQRKTHLDDAGHSVDIAGYVVETTMALIAAVRGLIRDIITTVLGDIISTMLVALALAIPTFGASIPIGVTKCVAEASVQAAAMAAKIAKVGAFAGRVAGRLKNLSGLTKGSKPGRDGSIELDSRPNTPHDPAADTPHLNDTPDTTTTPHDDTSSTGTPHDDTSSTGTPHDDTDGTTTPHDDTTDTPGGSQNGEDDPFDTWLAADQHYNGPHEDTPGGSSTTPHDDTTDAPHDDTDSTTTPHDDTDSTTTPAGEDPPAATGGSSGPKSELSDQDIRLLKKHEDWLKSTFGTGTVEKAKFVDTWIKNNAPDSYPIVKAMADAKSSKNWVGWVGKDIITVDKQLTDIQTRAEDAWNQSDEKWREEHPDPATT